MLRDIMLLTIGALAGASIYFSVDLFRNYIYSKQNNIVLSVNEMKKLAKQFITPKWQKKTKIKEASGGR